MNWFIVYWDAISEIRNPIEHLVLREMSNADGQFSVR